MKALAAKPQTAGSVRRALAAANRGVTAPMIAVSVDRQGWLDEVRLCLGPRMKPARCRPFQAGAKEDRKSTRLTPVTNAHIVCRLMLEKNKTKQNRNKVTCT